MTPGYHLVAIDAKTGKPDPKFGKDGVVDLMDGLGYPLVPWAVDDTGPLIISEAAPPRKAKPGETWDAVNKIGADGSVTIFSSKVDLGTGVETRSFCYVSDIVDGFLIAVEKLEENQLIGPLNLGSESRISIGDLAREIIRISGKDIEIKFDRSHPTVIWGQALDCSLAKEVLDGWIPRVSMSEGLEKCYRQIERQLSAETVGANQ